MLAILLSIYLCTTTIDKKNPVIMVMQLRAFHWCCHDVELCVTSDPSIMSGEEVIGASHLLPSNNERDTINYLYDMVHGRIK